LLAGVPNAAAALGWRSARFGTASKAVPYRDWNSPRAAATAQGPLSLLWPTRCGAVHQRLANAEGADAERAPADAHSRRHATAMVGALLPGVAVVLDEQLPLVRTQLLQAA